MTPLTACTIVSKNYLPFARVLAHSFREWEPDGRFFVLLVDRIDDRFDPEKEPFEVLEVESLENLPEPSSFLFKYSILESNTAVKPFLMQDLLERFDLPNLVYFDPDIRIYGPLDELREVVAASSMVLTPHLDAPIDDDHHPGEKAILQSGAYNLGFLALRRGEEATRLLDWWQKRLYDQCVVRVEEGLFVDQKWMDLAPSLYRNVSILRDPGYNVAYWNLHSRRVETTSDGPRVGDRPLVFFHFSGIEPESLDRVSKHQDRFRLDQIGDAAELYRDYAQELFAAGFRECRSWPFAFGEFDNGVPIPDSVRRLYLELPTERRRRFGDPFATEGEDSFWTWLNRAAPRTSGRLSRYLLGLYRRRPDLHSRFPDPGGRDLEGFSGWMHEYGRHELRVAPEFLADLPRPRPSSLLTRHGLENRLRRAYRSPLATRLRERGKRLLGPTRTARWRGRLKGPETSSAPGPERLRPITPLPERIKRPGINLVGYLRAETGMGEAARSLARALEAADLPHTLHSLDLNVIAPNRDPRFAEAVSDFRYDVNLIVANADQVPDVFRHLGPEATAGRANVGLWLWELDELPPSFEPSFGYLHEIWTPSSFCVDAFGTVAPVPVRRVPLPVVPLPPRHGREHFGLPEGEFLFLFLFNYLSYFERKNPLGLIEAFRRAFTSDDEVRLVLKTSQSDFAPQLRQRLEDAIGTDRITLLDGYYSAEEVSGLMASCDAYASLHRSEGYGLTLAEAMYHGKPVVATDYSGTSDFFGVSNGYPVRWTRVPIRKAAGPYPVGAQWADPDLDHAAEQLRRVVDDEETRARIAARGRDVVRGELDPATVGALIRRRFATLLHRIERG